MKIIQNYCKKKVDFISRTLFSFSLYKHFFNLLFSDGSEMNGKLFDICSPIKTRKRFKNRFPNNYLSIQLKKVICDTRLLFLSICTNVYCFHVGQALNSSMF